MRTVHAGGGLVLDPIGTRHARELFSIVDAERARLRIWLPWVDRTRRIGDTRAFLRVAASLARKGTEYIFVLRRQGRLVGVASLRVDAPSRKGSLGYWLREEALGLGLAASASRCLAEYAFDELGLNRVEIRCAVGNVRSRKVARRLGMKLEGIERQAELVNGRFLDHAVYSMLASSRRRRER